MHTLEVWQSGGRPETEAVKRLKRFRRAGMARLYLHSLGPSLRSCHPHESRKSALNTSIHSKPTDASRTNKVGTRRATCQVHNTELQLRQTVSFREHFDETVERPFCLLVLEPIVLLFSLYRTLVCKSANPFFSIIIIIISFSFLLGGLARSPTGRSPSSSA